MSEEVLLDVVKIMCKDVWINETWLDLFTDTCGLFQNNTPEFLVQVFFVCPVKKCALVRNDSWSWKVSKAMKLD